MAGRDAFGTTISMGDGADPETYAAVGNVTNVSGLSSSREAYDVTAHDSTGGWREFIGGLKDGGEVSFDVNFDPTEHIALVTDDFAKSNPVNWELAYPNGTTRVFAAIITSGEDEAPHDGKLEGSITLKVSGQPTDVEGS